MKYIAPEMEMKELEVEDIIMSVVEDDSKDDGSGGTVTPDDNF